MRMLSSLLRPGLVPTLALLASVTSPLQAQQASLTLLYSDATLCHRQTTDWSIATTVMPDQDPTVVAWDLDVTRGLDGPAMIAVDGVVTIHNSGSGEATIGNIVVNLQAASGKKWMTRASDVADATSGDQAILAKICSGASSEGRSQFAESAASGRLEFMDAATNTAWALVPQKVLQPGESVDLLFVAEFDNSVLLLPEGVSVRAEVIVTFGNAGRRGGSGASCAGVDIDGSGTLDPDEAYVRSVPTRLTRAIPVLDRCHETVFLAADVAATGTVTWADDNIDDLGLDEGIWVDDSASFVVTATGVAPGADGGKLCLSASLDLAESLITLTRTVPDGECPSAPADDDTAPDACGSWDFICCPAVHESASACADVVPDGVDPAFQDGDFCAYSQGGYGGPGEPHALLRDNWTLAFPAGFVEVGTPGQGGFSMKFTSAAAIGGPQAKGKPTDGAGDYLPASRTAGPLTGDLVNPTSSSSGILGGQVLTVRINIALSDAGSLPAGLGDLYYCNVGDSLSGLTLRQVLAAAETALGGGALPAGHSYSSLSDLVRTLGVDAFHECVVAEVADQLLRRTACP